MELLKEVVNVSYDSLFTEKKQKQIIVIQSKAKSNKEQMVAAANMTKRAVKRYRVLIKFMFNKHEFFFRTSLNAKDKNDAIEQATTLLHKDVQNFKYQGVKVVERQAEYVDVQYV